MRRHYRRSLCPSIRLRETAARFLLHEACEDDGPEFVQILLSDTRIAKRVFAAAAKKAHPDNDGTDDRMRAVKSAWDILSDQ